MGMAWPALCSAGWFGRDLQSSAVLLPPLCLQEQQRGQKDPPRAASTGLTPGEVSELQVPASWEAMEQKYQNPPLRNERLWEGAMEMGHQHLV